ncbi:hypothetical protein Leryth_001004 [Lithospermum erythrorhizon]|nr:hypothetical protein Leryth_001004 [Lithospermum erythrorhizon]
METRMGESSSNGIMKVMVAIDESDTSFYALRWTLEHVLNHLHRQGTTLTDPDEAVGESTAMVTIVHAQQPFQPFVYPAGPVVYPSTTVIEAVTKAQNENTASLLTRALHMCKERMVKAETLILKGDPKEAICQTADDLHVDLLVVGSRGLSSLKRAFLGSVSDYCAHHVHRPILIVRPPKETKK